jgi:Cu2+-containing amine oxidase
MVTTLAVTSTIASAGRFGIAPPFTALTTWISLSDIDGAPVPIPNAICLHEEDHGTLAAPDRRRRGAARLSAHRRRQVRRSCAACSSGR